MYEIRRYVEVNALGAANVLDIIANTKHNVRKMIVASSMSIYGEGRYHCKEHLSVSPGLRETHQFDALDWEMRCPICHNVVAPQNTDEDKPLLPASIYATTKRDHEEMFLQVGMAYKIPTVALRYFNVYGQRQALSNPYTGIVAIFSTALLAGAQSVIFEDGLQSRDFVHVSDIVQANMLALNNQAADYGVFNVGTGVRTSVLDMHKILSESLGVHIEPKMLNRFRYGDIRHCFADISRISTKLGYKPLVKVAEGIREMASELDKRQIVERTQQMLSELQERGLTT
jgi:dTDP-L-rhamnose 4-epimerase